MADMFRVEMLPARYGDCLWLEYGDEDDVHRVLVDGGPVETFPSIEKRLKKVPQNERVFELMVLTHVDADHLEGVVRLFAEKPLPFVVRKVWFNGWRQMEAAHGLLGAAQGEFLSALLADRAPNAWDPDGPPWVIPKDGVLPVTTLPGGLKLTLLSPTVKKLDAMAKEWKKVVTAAGIPPGDLDAAWQLLATRKKFLPKKGLLGTAPNLDKLLKAQFVKDQAKPNGSSIAVLAEYKGRSVLLLADAHPDTVAESVKKLCRERGVSKLPVGAVKVSHHGSKGNTSVALIQLIDSPKWLISTNGDRFQHPHKPSMARIVKYGRPKEIWFNYSSKYTKPWLAKDAQKKHSYKAVVRSEKAASLPLDL
jgi:hypothetical protein